MNDNITRRNFLGASAALGAIAGLAACGSTGDGGSGAASGFSVPAADAYPIDPDGDDVEAKWTSEVVGETRQGDGWTRYTNPDGGATLGVMDTSKIIQVDGYAFKDLNGNGKLDLYEDWRQSPEDRAKALSDSMKVEEIYPLMFNTSFFDSTYPLSDQELEIIHEGARTTCNNQGRENGVEAAKWNNAVQQECEKDGGYGIPHMTSFDPFFTYGFPGNMSMAATFDPDCAHTAARYMSEVWRHLGLHLYYGPQIGITTDPRWVRLSGGFSEDPALARDMTASYVDGLQSSYDDDGNDLGWGPQSIICQAKHFPGGGAAEGGRYDHVDSGKYNVYPGDNFRATFIPFVDGAMKLAGKTGCVGSIMPDYNIYYSPDDEYGEPVGVAFDTYKSGILRDALGDRLVSSDWDITSNFDTPGQLREGGSNHAWGVQDLTPAEREARALEAGGVDQFGGEFELAIVEQAHDLMVSDLGQDKADEVFHNTARRVFTAMNNISLFDNPYIGIDEAQHALDNDDLTSAAKDVAQKAVIMLKNKGGVIKQRDSKPKVYVPMNYTPAHDEQGFDPSTMSMAMRHVAASWDLPLDKDVLEAHFDLVCGTLGDPTGEADETTGEPGYLESDYTPATADEIAACDFALAFITSPQSGNGYDDATQTYLPISLQYRPYTADGDNVRKTSLVGNPLDGSDWATHGSFKGVEMENRSYFGQSVTASNESELDGLLAFKETLPEGLPLVLAVTMQNPMCFGEVEPSADAIILTFNDGLTDDIRLGAIAGEFEPSGLLPVQQPKDMDTVEAQFEDVPRDMDCYVDSEGNSYDFGFGLNWSGVIDDERTATYKVAPLTEPENPDVSF